MPSGNPSKHHLTAAVAAILAVAAAVLLYYSSVDPSQSRFAPKCMFKALTGYDCPGCGSQRALHALVGGDFAAVWSFNPFLFFAVPVGLLYLTSGIWGSRMPRLRRALISPAAIVALVIITAAWWIIRNIIA